MARIIAVVNQKGGVGKTTTSINLAAYLARRGKFVLLVDLDPQGNASSGLGLGKTDRGIYETLSGEVALRETLLGTAHEGLKVAPATPALAGARVELVDVEDREFRLHRALLPARNDYDFIIIDCGPSLDLLTVNGLAAADEILVPVQAEYYALEGLSQLLETIDLVRQHLKPNLRVLGAVLTMHDRRHKLSEQILAELADHFPHRVFRTVVPRNVRLSEAPSFGQSILDFDPTSKGARAYEQLADEVLGLEPVADVPGVATAAEPEPAPEPSPQPAPEPAVASTPEPEAPPAAYAPPQPEPNPAPAVEVAAAGLGEVAPADRSWEREERDDFQSLV